MQVNPDAERFGDIKRLQEIMPGEGDLVATGTEEQLTKLQEALRKAGYKKAPSNTPFNTGPSKP